MTIIAPSLLAANFLELKKEIISIEEAGADWLHIDVMDGHFVDNLSFGFPIIEALKPISNLFFDVHLMIENPQQYIEKYIQAGANSITIHEEIEEDIMETIQKIKRGGAKAGIALKPTTPFENIKTLLGDIDLVLFMSVEPGFGGQSFRYETIEKLKEANQYRKEQGFHKLKFQVDGGINSDTARLCREEGVDILVAGTVIFKEKNRKDIIGDLRGIEKEAVSEKLDDVLYVQTRKKEITEGLTSRFGHDGEVRHLQEIILETENANKIKDVHSLFLLGKSYNEIKKKIEE